MIIDTTILGGLPVAAEVTFHGAEPDVGLMRNYAEIQQLYFVRRTSKKRQLRAIPASIWDKAEKAGDLERIEFQAMEDEG